MTTYNETFDENEYRQLKEKYDNFTELLRERNNHRVKESVLETRPPRCSVVYATFSPDGETILSAGLSEIILWDAQSKNFPPLQELIDQTRERFKDRPLTPEERRKYYLE